MTIIRQMALKDIPEVVRLHIDSFKHSLNIIAGKRYLSAVFTWFIETKNIALVSENNGQITGYVIGAPIGYEKAMNRSLWLVGATGLLLNPARIFNIKLFKNIIQRIKSILSPDPLKGQPLVKELGKGISLVGIAVTPENKGDGTAAKLVDSFEAKANELHVDFVRLSVLAENIRAQRFYEKMGWAKHEVPKAFYYYKKLSRSSNGNQV